MNSQWIGSRQPSGGLGIDIIVNWEDWIKFDNIDNNRCTHAPIEDSLSFALARFDRFSIKYRQVSNDLSLNNAHRF